jgi:hypothetical protein
MNNLRSACLLLPKLRSDGHWSVKIHSRHDAVVSYDLNFRDAKVGF